MWYAEIQNIFGGWSRMSSADYPPDRTADGSRRYYRVRVEVAPEHAALTLDELSVIYGTKAVAGTEKTP